MLNLHYVAGIIDGEGCICFDYAKKTGMLRVQVRVSMATEEIPTRLCQQFGGYLIKGHSKQKNQRDPFIWVIRADSAVAFLGQIESLLIIKSAQAQIALTFNKLRPDLDKATHQFFKQMMHKLNKVGRGPEEINLELEELNG